MSTKEKIAAKALEMFNKQGIEYVGLRELAALLKMRVSNITYYYPTKDDLVNELGLRLKTLNSQTIIVDRKITITSFFKMMQTVFRNHLQYSCLFLSVVHLLQQNKVMSARYAKTQQERTATLKVNIETLSKTGYLKALTESDRDYIVSSIALIARFWISESAITFRNWTAEEQINHYLSLIAKLLSPYATAKGKREISAFIEAKVKA